MKEPITLSPHFTVFVSGFFLLCFLFVVAFPPLISSDYLFHRDMAIGACSPELVEVYSSGVLNTQFDCSNFQDYAPMVSWVSFFPSSFGEIGFQLFWFFFIFVFFPISLVFLFKTRRLFFLYFVVCFPFATWFAFLLPQALVSFFAVLLVFVLTRFERFWFLVPFFPFLMSFTHSFGLEFFALVFGLFVLYQFVVFVFNRFEPDFRRAIVVLGAVPLLPPKPLLSFPWFVVLFKWFSVPLLFFVRRLDFCFVLFVVFSVLSLFYNPRIVYSAVLFLVISVARQASFVKLSSLRFFVLFVVLFFLQLLL